MEEGARLNHESIQLICHDGADSDSSEIIGTNSTSENNKDEEEYEDNNSGDIDYLNTLHQVEEKSVVTTAGVLVGDGRLNHDFLAEFIVNAVEVGVNNAIAATSTEKVKVKRL